MLAPPPRSVFALLCVAAIPASLQAQSLSTTFANDNFQDGSMFNVISKAPVRIDSLDVHFDDFQNPVPCGASCSVTEVEVYASPGGYVGKQNDPSAWTLLGTVQHTISTAPGTPQPLGLPLDLCLDPAGVPGTEFKYGLYVTNTGTTNAVTGDPNENILYTEGGSEFEDAALKIKSGLGVEYPFATFFTDRTWNGAVHYSPLTSTSGSLSTTFDDDNFQDGNMFNVVAKTPIVLRSFDVHFDDFHNPVPCGGSCSVTEVEVYASAGGYVGKQNTPGAWTLVGSTQHTTATGEGVPQPLDLPLNLALDPTGVTGAPLKYGLYVTNTGTTNSVTAGLNENQRYTEGASTYEDASVRFVSGIGIEYPFASFFPNRTWNGTLHYTALYDALETTFAHDNFQDGNMFNLVAKKALTVRGLDVHVSDTLNPAPCGASCSVTEMAVYSSPGGYVGKQNDPSAWSLHGTVQHTVSTGPGTAQPLDLPLALSMDPTGVSAPFKYGLYVTTTGTTNSVTGEVNENVLYTEGMNTYETDELKFISGVGNEYPFATFFPDRTWNGRVHYSCEQNVSAPYCTAGTSASGCQVHLNATGLGASATASSGFVINAPSVEGAKNGGFLFGITGRQALPWVNSSWRCTTPPTFRTGLLSGVGTPGQCDGFFSLDINALWCATCPAPPKNPGAGATVGMQLWYRDPLQTAGFGPASRLSFSDALEFDVLP